MTLLEVYTEVKEELEKKNDLKLEAFKYKDQVYNLTKFAQSNIKVYHNQEGVLAANNTFVPWNALISLYHNYKK